MKNSLGRFVPDGYKPFENSSAYKAKKRVTVKEKHISQGFEELADISEMFDKLKISDGMTLSFHHHSL